MSLPEPIATLTATQPAMADALSCDPSGEHAAADAAERLASALASQGVRSSPDLLVAFVSSHHARSLAEIERILSARLAPRHVIAVSGEGVIAGGLEIETTPGVALLGAVLPGVSIRAFSSDELPMSIGIGAGLSGGGSEASGSSRGADASASSTSSDSAHHQDDLATIARSCGIGPGHRCTLLLADPFTTPINPVLATLSRARAMAGPSASRGAEDRRGVIAGGLASASGRPGGNTMLVDGRLQASGFVGVSLSGAIRADSVLSQGCKPIGENMVVTSARGQFIRTLGGRPALDVLHELIECSSEADREQIASGLLLGRVINEYKDHFGRADYLLRNVVGVMKPDKAIAVADAVRVGQTVRFHVRDAQTAHEDLAMLMDAQAIHERPLGGLLFTCNGRGSKLFPQGPQHPHNTNHDAAAIQRAFAMIQPGETRAKAGSAYALPTHIPLAGFFAAGEIGPVGDEVFLHGQTASAVLFRKV